MQLFFFKNTKSNRATVLVDCDFVKNWENSKQNRIKRMGGYIDKNGNKIKGY